MSMPFTRHYRILTQVAVAIALFYIGFFAFLAPVSAVVDSDGDGYTDAEEDFLGTDPNDADTDDDDVTDYQEALLATDPLEFDTISGDEYASDYELDNDADGLSNGYELNDGVLGDVQVGNFTGEGGNPNNADTDEDGLGDWFEATYAGTCVDITIDNSDHDEVLDPDEDCDEDGLTNQVEEDLGSSPLSADTDADGHDDTEEQEAGSDPADADDTPLSDSEPLTVTDAIAITGGQVTITTSNDEQVTVQVFQSAKKPRVKMLPDASGVVALARSGRRIAIVDATGTILDRLQIRKQKQDRVRLRSWDLGSDGTADIVVVTQRGRVIRTTWVLYEGDIGLNGKQTQRCTRSGDSNFTIKRDTRTLRLKNSGHTLVRYKLRSDGNFMQKCLDQ